MEEIRIQVLFTITDPDTGLSYTDALYFTQEEYDSISHEKIEELKNERFNNWRTAIDTAVSTVTKEPAKEQILKGIK